METVKVLKEIGHLHLLVFKTLLPLEKISKGDL